MGIFVDEMEPGDITFSIRRISYSLVCNHHSESLK